jgi:hypothetical protein
MFALLATALKTGRVFLVMAAVKNAIFLETLISVSLVDLEISTTL